MEIKEAIAYLRPIADGDHLKQYSAALDTAIRCMEEVEALRKELRDERDRFDRLTDFELAEAMELAVLRAQQKEDKALTNRKQLTNADRILAMSDEELAEFLSEAKFYCKGICKNCLRGTACTSMLQWLRRPAEEADHDR